MAGLLDLAGMGDMSGLLGGSGADPTTLGLSLMQSAGPSPVRMPIGAVLGNAGLQAQQTTLNNRLKQAALAQQLMQLGMTRQEFALYQQQIQRMQAQQAANQTAQGGPAQAAVNQSGGLPTPMTPQQVANSDLPGGISPDFVRISGLMAHRDPLATENEIQSAQIAQQKRTLQPVVSQIDSVLKSDNPAQALYGKGNEGLASAWPQLAAGSNIDPSALTDRNVQLALQNYRNKLVASTGEAAGAPPERFAQSDVGYGGVAQTKFGSGQTSAVLPREVPTFAAGEKVYDPVTQTYTVPYVQTGGYGAFGSTPNGKAPATTPPPRKTATSGNTATAGAPTPGGGTRVAGSLNVGSKEPSAENNKAAMFGSEMRAGLQTLNGMEAQGFRLSPKARAVAISMATDESSSPMGQLLQQYIAAKALSPDEQVYISAMMPLLQAAGHDQSGARLTTAQIRQNVEGLMPLGTDQRNLNQVHKNRSGFYEGLLSQAGPAINNPKYKSTLFADEKQAETAGSQAPAAALAYLKAHPETADHFKAKYGYLPQ